MSETPNTSNLPVSEAIPTQVLEGEELKNSIRKQIEFYFSPQNLPKDTYLRSQMDGDHFVPLKLIAGFSKIKSLTDDLSLIIDSLKSSSLVLLSEDNTKLKLKEEKRTRVILHNLPQETVDKDVADAFSKGKFFPEIRRDVNNCWFISFETEEEATAGLEFIREEKIHGQSIRARLKSESTRAIYNPPDYNPSYFLPTPQNSFNPTPFYNWGGPIQGPGFWDQGGEPFPQGKDAYRRYGKKGARNNRKFDNKKTRGARRNKGNQTQKKQPPVQLGPSDFPPLPSSKNEKNMGYSGDFKKYSQKQLEESIYKLKPVKPSNSTSEFPFKSEPITKLEIDGAVPLSGEDFPPKKKPNPSKKASSKESSQTKKKQEKKQKSNK